MKFLHDLKLLTLRPFIANLRNPTWLFVGFSTPVMYLVLFLPLLNNLTGGLGVPNGSNVIELFLPGILALLAFGSGTGSAFGTFFELKSGLIERLRVTPASRFALLLGPILSGTVWTLLFSAVVIALSTFFGFHIHIIGLLVFAVLLILLLFIFSAVFTSIAIITHEINSFAAITNGINLPILLLSGVLLPLSLAPEWMRVIAHLNPLYYVVNAGRDLVGGNIATQAVWLAFVVIVPLTVLVLLWATNVYRKAVS